MDVCGSSFKTTEIQVVKSTTRLASDSRNATVEVFSIRPEGVAFGTGTVFKYKGNTIVLTAAHVIGGVKNTIGVSTGYEELAATLVYYDESTDLAVLVLPETAGVDPMKLRPLKEKGLKIGQDVLYSGYPNLSGLLTIEGYIAGVHSRGDLYMHSYGWSGASGSAVFDLSGKLVGILVALDVGTGYVGMPEIIEDVVVVVPVWKLNFNILDSVLEV